MDADAGGACLDGASIVTGRDRHADSVALQTQHALADDVPRVPRAGGNHHITCDSCHSIRNTPCCAMHELDRPQTNLHKCLRMVRSQGKSGPYKEANAGLLCPPK